MTTEHIPIEALFERARLKTALSDNAQIHLASCDHCRNQLSWMEVAADLELQDPPQSVMDKVIQAGRNKSRLKQLRNVITALLTFDSFKLAPVGVRSEGTSSRQMTFDGEGVEVGVWLRPLPEQKMAISGQVSSKSSGPIQDTSAYVDLVVDGDHVKSTPLSSWGEFVFHDLPQIPCSLQIYFRDRVMRIEPIAMVDKG
jgi:hypothetical protein